MVAKRCEVCNRWFRKRKGVRFCSRLCCRRRPEYKEILSKREKEPRNLIRKLKYHKGPKGRKAWLRGSSKAEIKKALRVLGRSPKSSTIILLYRQLINAVNKSKAKARSLIKGGIPDAKYANVEFKVGVDHLRKDQLIYDILNGRKGKIRWMPSWDSLELLLEKKGKDESLFFHSYFSYLKWCDSKAEMPKKEKKQNADSTRS